MRDGPSDVKPHEGRNWIVSWKRSLTDSDARLADSQREQHQRRVVCHAGMVVLGAMICTIGIWVLHISGHISQLAYATSMTACLSVEAIIVLIDICQCIRRGGGR